MKNAEIIINGIAIIAERLKKTLKGIFFLLIINVSVINHIPDVASATIPVSFVNSAHVVKMM